jgi:hypothetical protein
MKKLLLVAAIGISGLLASPSKAQVRVNINIGTQPEWVPSGYSQVDYYYLPEIESYYYVPSRQFVFYSGNQWVHSTYLPARYRSYDLRRGRKIVINGDRPYLQHRSYRAQYNFASYRPERRAIYRDDRRGHYFSNRSESRGHDRHDYDRHERGGNNGRHEGRGNHGGHGRH